jgi:hypothetical protein
VLSSVPADGNDSRDEVVSVVPQGPGGHGGDGQRKGCVIVVSHPKEFRKPNYLLALATGERVSSVVRDSHNSAKFSQCVWSTAVAACNEQTVCPMNCKNLQRYWCCDFC